MSETWLQDYIFLAFRLHRVVETIYGSPFVEDYWGPEAWRKLVEAEPETVPADLVRQASDMLEGVWCNAAMLLDEGRSEAEVAQYFVKYMLLSEESAFSYVAMLKHPLHGLHVALTLWNRSKTNTVLVTGVRQGNSFPAFFDGTMAPLTVGRKYFACLLSTQLRQPWYYDHCHNSYPQRTSCRQILPDQQHTNPSSH